jgi:WD40 repeat protein
VVEILHNNPKVFSSADPQRLWLVDGQGKHQVTIPSGLTNWFVLKDCVSPDGQFVALHSWQAQSNKKRSRVIHLGNLQSGQWTTVQVPDTALELVGWTGKGSKGVVLTGMDFDKKSIRKPYSLEAATGQLVPLESMPAWIDPDHRHSPDGKRSIEVIGTERLVISDLGTGQKREFIFNPYDRRNVFPGSVHWVNDRYLAFESSRMALINTETLKMNFVADKGSKINVAEFSPDFKFAIGTEKDDTHYLGTVQTPE